MSGKNIAFVNIPVITPPLRLLHKEELKLLSNHMLYLIWKDLSEEEKRLYRGLFQETLESQSLVFLNKKKDLPPELRDALSILKLQFPEGDYNWEEEDLVKTLEKTHWLYEPIMWESYQRSIKKQLEKIPKEATVEFFLRDYPPERIIRAKEETVRTKLPEGI